MQMPAALPALSFLGKQVRAGPCGAYAVVDGIGSHTNNTTGLCQVLKKQVKICA